MSDDVISLDEDIFDFAAVESERAGASEDIDLDEIFAALEDHGDDGLEFAEDEDEAAPEEQGAVEIDEDDILAAFDGFDCFDDTELIGEDHSAPAPVSAATAEAALGQAQPASAPAAVDAPRGRATAALAPVAAAAPGQLADPVAVAGQPTTIRVEGTSPRTMIFLVLAITSINALVALVTVKSTSQMRDSVWEGVREVANTAEVMRSETLIKAGQLTEQILPITSPNAGDHPTFGLAAADIREQRYSDARQKLYALLALIDRLDDSERAEVEAKANYMIAQTKHLEAIQSGVDQ